MTSATNGERGNTKHGPKLDDEMEQETRGMVQGHGRPHAEEFRETEPLPDDTDGEDVVRAFEVDSVGVKHSTNDDVETPSSEDVKRLAEGDDE